MSIRHKVSFFTVISTFFMVLTFVQSPSFVLAQEQGGEITLEVSPEYPLAGQDVTVSLHTRHTDVRKSLITWRINGELITQAYSKNMFTFTAGKTGSVMRITATVEDYLGKQVEVEKMIRVGGLHVVWEGDTYAHPFYEGRTLQSPGATVTIKALPTIINSTGGIHDADDLFYFWTTVHSRTIIDEGRGAHTITTSNNMLFDELNILLVVEDSTGTKRAEQNVHIPNTSPTVQLYKNNPLVGVNYSNAVTGEIGLYDEGVEIVAEPYFMSAVSRNDTVLEYTWIVDGKEDNRRGVYFLDPEEISTTRSSVTVPLRTVVKNSLYWLQSTHTDINVITPTKDTWLDN